MAKIKAVNFFSWTKWEN